jgi:hypothetical protein
MKEKRSANSAWICTLTLGILLGIGSAPGEAQSSVATERRARPSPPVHVVPLSCAEQPETGRAFCVAYNAAIEECSSKRAAADVRACFAARVPTAPPPACPPRGAIGVSSSDRSSCDQHALRYARCAALVGEANVACLTASAPVTLEKDIAQPVAAPSRTLLPVAPVASSGAAPTGVGPMPPVIPMVPGNAASIVAPPRVPVQVLEINGVRP